MSRDRDDDQVVTWRAFGHTWRSWEALEQANAAERVRFYLWWNRVHNGKPATAYPAPVVYSRSRARQLGAEHADE